MFRDNDEVSLISRNGRDLTVYFPEVVAGLLAALLLAFYPRRTPAAATAPTSEEPAAPGA